VNPIRCAESGKEQLGPTEGVGYPVWGVPALVYELGFTQQHKLLPIRAIQPHKSIRISEFTVDEALVKVNFLILFAVGLCRFSEHRLYKSIQNTQQ
jgi:hypothetical protein